MDITKYGKSQRLETFNYSRDQPIVVTLAIILRKVPA